MKRHLLFALPLFILASAGNAQEGRPRNPRLAALVEMKEGSALQDSIKVLKNSENESDVQLLINYYTTKKDTEKSDETTELLKKRFPNGRAAFNEIGERIYNERDPKENEKNYKELVKRFGSKPEYNLDGSRYYVAITFLGKNKPQKVMEYLNMIQNPVYKPNAFSYAARESIAAKDYQLGETLIRKTFADINRDTSRRGMDEYSRILSELLYANEKYDEGFPYAEGVYERQSKLKSVTVSVTLSKVKATYLDYLIRLKKYKEAYPLIEELLKTGAASSLVKEKFKDAYVALNGTDKGFAEHVVTLNEILKQKIREDVEKKMINTAAYDFELKDINGKSVKLSDFKGKTVILDFWATWCGPCKASFPVMQEAIERYKKDKDVVFLFIHTMETATNATKAAADYINDKKFGFTVLMDLKDPITSANQVAAEYKVNAIPAKFIIDGSGNIRFKTIGNSAAGSDAFIEEMDVMIDMAKKR